MIKKIIYWLTGHLKCRIIDSNGRPYLERYYVGTIFKKRVFIHRFVASDPDRGLHNHPWKWALSWILVGGYRELLKGKNGDSEYIYSVLRKPWSFNYIKDTTMHRVMIDNETTQDAWSLFIHGPREKGWGFLEYEVDETCNILKEQYHELDMKEERKKNQHWWEHPDCKTGNEIRKNIDV